MIFERFEIEAETPYSESLIWQLNRDFYQEKGISAWSDGTVPHNMTSNSKVGKTYAELIFAFLKDLGLKGRTSETVYILELGAGHGRLAFHVLKHLEKLVASTDQAIPLFCYVLSDIVEDNLSFFDNHPQFQDYLEKGMLDVTYFDAYESKKLYLRNAEKTIYPKDLNQPILAIANYFFDSLPTELFFIQNKEISSCSISIDSKEDPEGMSTERLLKSMEFSYSQSVLDFPVYKEPFINEILEDYTHLMQDSYLLFPKKSIQCLRNIKSFSKAGLVLLTMDKGYHELHNLTQEKEPEIIRHGSISLWVNYHALGAYCKKQGGKVLFPKLSNFNLELGCLLFLEDGETYLNTDAAYEEFINNFGPDDFNSIKRFAYANVSRLRLTELIALFRMSSYDSTFFIKLIPRLKKVSKAISFNERTRLAETMDCVWEKYFNINESFDLAYEIGGMLYDLGYYIKALSYFQHSVDIFGEKADIYYNQALCYYQLRKDKLFLSTLNEFKKAFPEDELIEKLEYLDMG